MPVYIFVDLMQYYGNQETLYALIYEKKKRIVFENKTTKQYRASSKESSTNAISSCFRISPDPTKSANTSCQTNNFSWQNYILILYFVFLAKFAGRFRKIKIKASNMIRTSQQTNLRCAHSSVCFKCKKSGKFHVYSYILLISVN